MIDDVGKPQTDGTGLMARRLAGETGITEGQGRELVSVLGRSTGRRFCVKPGC